jgi:hypothetical protein
VIMKFGGGGGGVGEPTYVSAETSNNNRGQPIIGGVHALRLRDCISKYINDLFFF